MATNFDPEEIKRLGKRFKKLDLDNNGALSVEEFMSLPELQQNPLVQRVIDIFDEDGNGEVDFKEFIQGVSQFSVKGDKSSKLKFAFKIYDMDNDGYISNGELFQVLKMMVGSNLKDTQLQQIVDKTILFADKDEDGKINFEEFCEVVWKHRHSQKDGGGRVKKESHTPIQCSVWTNSHQFQFHSKSWNGLLAPNASSTPRIDSATKKAREV